MKRNEININLPGTSGGNDIPDCCGLTIKRSRVTCAHPSIHPSISRVMGGGGGGVELISAAFGLEANGSVKLKHHHRPPLFIADAVASEVHVSASAGEGSPEREDRRAGS